MKKTYFSLFTLFFAALFFPGEQCRNIRRAASENARQTDGPYVLYKNDKVLVRYIMEDDGWKILKTDTLGGGDGASVTVNVATDDTSRLFQVTLKNKLSNEVAEYPSAKKIFVVSDIEGNFDRFRVLLQAHGVIDSSFNWTFGDGHLVLTGDFFDRGKQVTEVLWLIYSLEEKANAAGGHVHFILGNHEIMNLSGDLRYVSKKYFESAELLGEKYEYLFSENSELGRWLRTKNIVEKVGDVLFTHAGISPQVNATDLTLEGINTMARPWYADSSFSYPNPKIGLLMGDAGPFWYRGYYVKPSATIYNQLDSTLAKFNVKFISTGHTVMRDTVSAWYSGRLFDTDVHHVGGKSEALFIEDNKFYRALPNGERFLIKE